MSVPPNDKLNEPLKIQLALHGGGAKMAALLAAMQAVEELEAEGKLVVTRIAGASAGAVVGTLFAARIPMDAVRQSLENIDLSPYEGRVGKVRTLVRAFRGRSILDEEILASEFESVLRKSDAPLSKTSTLGALSDRFGIEVHLASSNLQKKQTHISGRDSKIIQSVVDSCAVPFVFRNYGSPRGTIVDGELCEGLPTDLLVDDEQNEGQIVAIGFESTENPAPTNFYQYLMAVIDTALTRSLDSINGRGRFRVHNIRASIGALDFATAFSPQYREFEHSDIKERAKSFFLDLVKIGQLQASVDEGRTEGDLLEEVTDNQPSAGSAEHVMMRRLGRIYCAMRDSADIRFPEYVLTVIANGLSESTDATERPPDEVRSSMKMVSEDGEAWGYGFVLSNADHETVLYSNECEVWDHNGDDVLAAVLPMDNPDKQDDRKNLGFFFKKPLKPYTKPYRIEFVDTVGGFTKPLTDTGADKFWISVKTSRINVARIVLHIPESFGEIDLAPVSARNGNISPISGLDLAKYKKESPSGFVTYGWESKGIEPGGRFEIQVVRK